MPAGELWNGSNWGSLSAESSLSSAEDSEKEGEIERGEREGLPRLRAMFLAEYVVNGVNGRQ